MPTAYLGIGSNLGNRKDNCRTAISHLVDSGIKVLRHSSMIETDPWGIKDQPPFINMAIKLQTDRTPEALLTLLKKIEITLGRVPGPRWGPRVIDLDILFYNNVIMDTAELKIPHQEIIARYFVLKPLVEIAPDLVHPVLKKSILHLLSELRSRS